MVSYRIKVFINLLNIKSNAPKKTATARETPTTIKVYLKVSCLFGQLTFFISNLTSFRKVVILVKKFIEIVWKWFKKRPFGHQF